MRSCPTDKVLLLVLATGMILGVRAYSETAAEKPSQYQVSLVTEVEIPSGRETQLVPRSRLVQVVQDFPGTGRNPAIIIADPHSIEYRWEDTSLLLRREFHIWEHPHISKQGRCIGVVSEHPNEEASFRVETWDGDVLWALKERWPSSHARLYWKVSDLGGAAARAGVGSSRMRIFSPVGEVLYEGPTQDSLSSGHYPGNFSADGRFYAETFTYLQRPVPANAPFQRRLVEIQPGRTCVAFWDALSGKELWRRWFRGFWRGPVAVSAEGDWVVVAADDCSLGTPEIVSRSFELVVLDQHGDEVARYTPPVDPDRGERKLIHWVGFSNDARFVGAEGPRLVWLVDLADKSGSPVVLFRDIDPKAVRFGFGAGDVAYLTAENVLYAYRAGVLHRLAELEHERVWGWNRAFVGVLSPGKVAVGNSWLQVYDVEQTEQ